MTTCQHLIFSSYSFFISFGFACYSTPDHLPCFVAHFNSVQLHRNSYRLLKSVRICDAIYAVVAAERILPAAWRTFSPSDPSLLPQFEQMNVWALKCSVT